MAQLILVRHGQASFGSDNYDKLSPLGHRQAEAVGRSLAQRGICPDLWACGTMVRQAETLAGIQRGLGITSPVDHTVHAGLDEYDFTALLDARFATGTAPDGIHTDRKVHFKNLRDTVALWQKDGIAHPPERWSRFVARTRQARLDLTAVNDAQTVLAVSSGGAIAQIVADVLGAPAATQTELQLQMKNAAMTTLIFSANKGVCYVHAFNETPFVTAETQDLLSYS